MRALRLWLSLALALSASVPGTAKVIDETATINGLTFSYKVVLPRDYDPGRAYPGILAFPPGGQGQDMVFTTLQRNWAPEAQRRGYIAVIPTAPSGRLFHEEGGRIFPGFLDRLLVDYKIRGGKFHVAGMSNGGISAFAIAAAYPRYFLSVTGFPGYLPDATPARVGALSGMCLFLHVGALDEGWRTDMEAQAALFRTKGYKVQMTVEPGEGHVIGALTGSGAARLFDEIEQPGCGK